MLRARLTWASPGVCIPAVKTDFSVTTIAAMHNKILSDELRKKNDSFKTPPGLFKKCDIVIHNKKQVFWSLSLDPGTILLKSL